MLKLKAYKKFSFFSGLLLVFVISLFLGKIFFLKAGNFYSSVDQVIDDVQKDQCLSYKTPAFLHKEIEEFEKHESYTLAKVIDCWSLQRKKEFNARLHGDVKKRFQNLYFWLDPYEVHFQLNQYSHDLGGVVEVSGAGGVLNINPGLTNIEIYDAVSESLVKEIPLTIELKSQACRSFLKGCGYPKLFNINSNDLGEGVFYFIGKNESEKVSEKIHFLVRKNSVSKPVLVIVPYLTHQAYNRAGGGSIYKEHSDQVKTGSTWITPPDQASALSIWRSSRNQIHGPYYGQTNNSPVSIYTYLKKLREFNLEYDLIADYELPRINSNFKVPKVLLFGGHFEYWTEEMVDSVLRLLNRGVNVANFSGNINWGRVQVINFTMYYKRVRFSEKSSQVFSNLGFIAESANPPEELFGVTYAQGGIAVPYQYRNAKAAMDAEVVDSHEEYDKLNVLPVFFPHHPIWKGVKFISKKAREKGGKKASPNIFLLNVDNGPPIFDHELDGLRMSGDSIDRENLFRFGFKEVKGLIKVPSVRDGKVKWGYAASELVHKAGGKIINFSTTNYHYILNNRKEADQIFENVINYLLEEKK